MNLSFEDELTFAPKLNSLSMKLAETNRTSIINRSPKEKNHDLDSSYTFKPTVSGNSSKIVAKLKTGFWERQSLHVKRQKEKIEQGPSTIHPNIKRSFGSRKDLNEIDKSSKSKIDNSISDDTYQKNSKMPKKQSPYSKSLDGLVSLKEKRLELQAEMNAFRKKCTLSKSPIVSKNSLESDHASLAIPSQTSTNQNNVVIVSPRKAKTISLTLRRSAEFGSKSNFLVKPKESTEGIKSPEKKHEDRSQLRGRSLTHPGGISKSKNDKLDLEHQKMMRAKKIASEALKGKKVFVCNGPYTTLRTALRKRGWIEKYFKSVPACCVEEDDKTDAPEENKDGEGVKIETNSNDTANETEAKEEDFAEVFSSDSQYGIMSRIVRNFAPSLIWTLRRDDINFRLLQKDQIVNHYVSAWTFTTKTGLCTNLRNIISFDSKDWRTFFPRCYRLCCEEEKAEFMEDYRLTAIQSILKLVISEHQRWMVLEDENEKIKEDMQKNCYEDCMKSNCASPTPKRNSPRSRKKTLMVLPSSALSLVFKKCYHYLDVRNNRDLDIVDDYSDQCLESLHWTTIMNYYEQITNSNAIIANAWRYAAECKEILTEMKNFCPQINIDGCINIWILKPGAKSRGRGIEIKSNLSEILSTAGASVSQKENKWVVQKYIERPFLVYRTKFDIRQWFLVTDWNPLVMWFYQDCYIRFCGQEFTLDCYDAQVHLSNNSIQKHFQNGVRSEKLPESNMWSSEEFKTHLKSLGKGDVWDDTIYPGMKSAIVASLQCCQKSLEYRKNSFELYGADFMLSEDLSPWLIEINSSPALGASTPITEILCRNVIEDTLKVVLDRRENKQADTGRFELAFRQPYVHMPSYMGCNLLIEGSGIKQNKPKPKEPKKSVSDDADKNVETIKLDVAVNKKDDESRQNKETKPVPKLVYEKKMHSSIDRSKLDGIIEKLSLGAAKFHGINRRNIPDKSNETKMEKNKSKTKLIGKQKSSTYYEYKANDTSPEFIEKQRSDIITMKVRSSLNTPTSTKPMTLASTNINNKTMAISIAEVIESRKSLVHDTNNCLKFKHNKVFKSDSFEPLDKCACCTKSDESLVDVLCPQVASYDLRSVKTYNPSHRLKKVKNMTKQRTLQSYSKQYGILDADDITGLKKAMEKQYKQLFKSNDLDSTNNVNNLALRPFEHM